MNKTNMTRENALTAALNSAHVTRAEARAVYVRAEGALWEIRFESDYLRYFCYVDDATGEAPGLLSEPLSMEELVMSLYATDAESAGAPVTPLNAPAAA